MGYFLNRKFLKACASGTRGEVDQLLRKGANIALVGSRGWPAIFIAAINDKIDVVELLIERKADLSIAVTARMKGELCSKSLLGWMFETNRIAIARLLIQHGARARNGYTYLHLFAEYGHMEDVRQLLEEGADIHAKTHAGKTPRDLAIETGHYAIADFLREKAEPVLLPPPPVESGWKRTPGQEEVTLVTDKKDIGYRLTDIFNFEERMYTRISRNLETNAESQSLRFFDEFNDTAVLETAHRELVQRGGKTDVSVIRNAILRK